MSKSHFMSWIVIMLICGGLISCASPAQDFVSMPREPKPYTVHIVNHGWHTGIVLPAEEMHSRLPQLAQTFPDATYLEFGWGDEAFYRADTVSAGLALRALLWPTSSVMHVVAVPDQPDSYFSAQPREKMCISRREYLALVDFIEGSFATGRSPEQLAREPAELSSLGPGLYGDSRFYRAVGRYHLFNNCNTWLARGLQAAGMRIMPTLMLTAQSLMDYLRERKEKTLQAGGGTACG